MKFRTEIESAAPLISLKGDERIVLLGSCFTDNIGGALRDAYWNVDVNPCGVQYNPESIARLTDCALSGSLPADTFFHTPTGLWANWLFPSAFSSVDERKMRQNVESAISRLGSALARARVLVITFGTAWVYRHAASADAPYSGIVGNCHKLPARGFERTRLSVESIVERWSDVLSRLRVFNPQLEVVFTVSPIRHLKDGLHGNMLSKSVLLLAVERLCDLHDNAVYFPAFEILNDDLRDYRFYASDMVHPSAEAVEYVWEKFRETCMSPQARTMTAEGEKLHRLLSHRPLTDDVAAIEQFQRLAQRESEQFFARYPFLSRP